MQAQASPIKLNPTTITIPPSNLSFPLLKLALTPHLTIQGSPLTDTADFKKDLKKDADAVFEVIVPVGGVIKVEVNIDRDALEKVGGAEMSIMEETDLEEVIKRKVLATFMTNRDVLSLQEVRSGEADSSFTLRPLAANAERSAGLSELVPSYQPIAHLTRLSISLNWAYPIKRSKPDEDDSEPSSQSSLPRPHDQDVTLEGILDLVADGGSIEQLSVDGVPDWAGTQLSSGLDQLIRSNFIKRFPLIFDADLPRYLPSITLSSNLINTITRVLSLSSSHRTDLFWTARRSLEQLVEHRNKIANHKLSQVINLTSRSRGRKRIKSDSQSESQGSDDPPPEPTSSALVTLDLDNMLESRSTTTNSSISSDLLKDGIAQIGWAEWKKKRCGIGRMSCRRIELSSEGSGLSTETTSPGNPAIQLNDQMRHLHIGDEDQWDGFFEDDDDRAFIEELGTASQDAGAYDDMFLDTDDDLDDNENLDDLFLPLDEAGHDDHFFDDDDYESDDDIEDYFLATDDEGDDSMNDMMDARMLQPTTNDYHVNRVYEPPDQGMWPSDAPLDVPTVAHGATEVMLEHVPATAADAIMLDTDDFDDAFFFDNEVPHPGHEEDMPGHDMDIRSSMTTAPHPSMKSSSTVLTGSPKVCSTLQHCPDIDIDHHPFDIALNAVPEGETEEEGMYSEDDRFFDDDEDEDMSLTPPSTPFARPQSDAPITVGPNGWFGDDWFINDPIDHFDLHRQETAYEHAKTPSMDLFFDDDEFMSDEEEEQEGGMDIYQMPLPYSGHIPMVRGEVELADVQMTPEEADHETSRMSLDYSLPGQGGVTAPDGGPEEAHLGGWMHHLLLDEEEDLHDYNYEDDDEDLL